MTNGIKNDNIPKHRLTFVSIEPVIIVGVPIKIPDH